MDNLKFKLKKKKGDLELSHGKWVKDLKILAFFDSTAHHGKLLPLLLEGSFRGPFSTQDFAFSSYCEVKL